MVSLLLAFSCFLVIMNQLIAASQISLPGCPSSCGNLTIPYPFGIGVNCARTGFDLSCNGSFSPKKTFLRTSNVEIFNISLSEAQVKARYYRAFDCYNKTGRFYSSPTGGAGSETPYTFSNLQNKFTVIGCDSYAYITAFNSSEFSGGCMSICSRQENIVSGSCSGLGCCQTAIPKGFKYYEIELKSYYKHTRVESFNPCSYAFLVEQNSFTFNVEDITEKSKYRSAVEKLPVVLDWVAGNETCEMAMRNPGMFACRSNNSRCYNSTSSATGYLCSCSPGYEGNPYLDGGCKDINECDRPTDYPCKGHCINTEGSHICICPKGTFGNATTFGCRHFNTTTMILGTVFPALFVTILVICIYALFEKRKRNKLVRRLYQQNGGDILERHLSAHKDIKDRFKIFTKEEMEKATNKFDDMLVLGHGGQGKVYKGTLSDGTSIAIKKSVKDTDTTNGGFINEIIILARIYHPNVVKLLGCCLEVDIPHLVYEFMPNKTLYEHIHEGRLPWEKRLRIAADVAIGLAHLHTVSIYHQDVKSANILLAIDYKAKISDFGASKLAPTDAKALSTMVQGTIGYLDPEFIVTHKLTSKSDVFSFGVVLAELLTGKVPISYLRDVRERSLAQLFKLSMEEDNIIDILDPQIVNVATDAIRAEMMEVAMLADRCLNMKSKDRPDMMEVFVKLEGLWRSGHHQSVEDGDVGETQNLIANRTLISLDDENEEAGMLFNTTSSHPCAFDIEGGR